MRRAMASAEVGDDAYGEDPTVNELERRFAERVGKEAALFVPSGTMGNQLALRVLAPPGSLVVAGRRQHVVAFEAGAAARNASVQFHLVDDACGELSPAEVSWAREAAGHHHPEVRLVCAESTHMASGGRTVGPESLAAVNRAAAGVPLHLDGARLFNAEVATGRPVAELAGPATTVMCCLSKGLCAPVGSLLAGPRPVVDAARFERQRLGGGMRQAGVLAACGLVALETMVERLVEDHHRARQLAAAVAGRWPEARLDPEAVETNIVCFTHPEPAALLEHLARHQVLAATIAPKMVRLVTHGDVDDEGVRRASGALATAPR